MALTFDKISQKMYARHNHVPWICNQGIAYKVSTEIGYHHGLSHYGLSRAQSYEPAALAEQSRAWSIGTKFEI